MLCRVVFNKVFLVLLIVLVLFVGSGYGYSENNKKPLTLESLSDIDWIERITTQKLNTIYNYFVEYQPDKELPMLTLYQRKVITGAVLHIISVQFPSNIETESVINQILYSLIFFTFEKVNNYFLDTSRESINGQLNLVYIWYKTPETRELINAMLTVRLVENDTVAEFTLTFAETTQ